MNIHTCPGRKDRQIVTYQGGGLQLVMYTHFDALEKTALLTVGAGYSPREILVDSVEFHVALETIRQYS